MYDIRFLISDNDNIIEILKPLAPIVPKILFLFFFKNKKRLQGIAGNSFKKKLKPKAENQLPLRPLILDFRLKIYSSKRMSRPRPFSSCINTLNDSGKPGSGMVSPFTMAS